MIHAISTGIQTGASTLQRGLVIPALLQRLQRQMEEQRLRALLEEQRDAPVDVQVGFQLYEDAPQELRSRLWMAILEHPKLVSDYQVRCACLGGFIRDMQRSHICPLPSFDLSCIKGPYSSHSCDHVHCNRRWQLPHAAAGSSHTALSMLSLSLPKSSQSALKPAVARQHALAATAVAWFLRRHPES
jgi:hypothetical protein